MPLYEYKCKNCGDVFEVMQKFSDAPLTVHEKCGGGPVEKLISTSAFAFKGSGFYITDYAKNAGSGNSSAKTENNEKSEKSNNGDKSEKSEKSSSEKSSSDKGEKTSSSSKSDSDSSSKPAAASPSTDSK